MHPLHELSHRIRKVEEELRELINRAEQQLPDHTHERYLRSLALMKNGLTSVYGASYCLRKFIKEQKI
jgi:hypothetical protein